MPCQPGFHSHDGYNKCHSVQITHKNPETQQAHQKALASEGKRTEETYRKGVQARAGQQPNAQSKKPVKSKTNYSSKLSAMFRSGNAKDPKYFPTLTIFFALASAQKVFSLFDKVTNEKAIANTKKGYEHGWDEIDKILTFDGKVKIDREWTKEERKQVVEALQDRLANIKDADVKNTVGYGEAMAYKTYLRYLGEADRHADNPEVLNEEEEEEDTFSITTPNAKPKDYPIKDPNGMTYRIDDNGEQITVHIYNKSNAHIDAKTLTRDEYLKYRDGVEELKTSDGRLYRAQYAIVPLGDKDGQMRYAKRFKKPAEQ